MNEFTKIHLLAHLMMQMMLIRGDMPPLYKFAVVFERPYEEIFQAVELLDWIIVGKAHAYYAN